MFLHFWEQKVEMKWLILSFHNIEYRQHGTWEWGSQQSLMCECWPLLFSKAHSCVSNVYRSVRRTHMDTKITPVCGCPWPAMLAEPLNDRIRLLFCVQLRLLMFSTGACVPYGGSLVIKKKRVLEVWPQHLEIGLTILVRTSWGHN